MAQISTQEPDVTFIIPAHNEERHIAHAIKAIERQTVDNWKLIIIDDASTDSTLSIVLDYAENDKRIQVLTIGNATGNACAPRKSGIMAATTEWISPLDADDLIEPQYLENLFITQKQTGADIVYPTRIDYNGKKLPDDSLLIGKPIAGHAGVKMTLDGWKFNCNGGIIKRTLFMDAYKELGSRIYHSYTDELLTRILLSLTPVFSISPAEYYYGDNPQSVTRQKSVARFNYIFNNIDLISFTAGLYGENSIEHRLAHKQNLHGIFDAIHLLQTYRFGRKEREMVLRLIKEARDKVNPALVKGNVSPYYYIMYKSGLTLSKIGIYLRDKIKKDGAVN